MTCNPLFKHPFYANPCYESLQEDHSRHVIGIQYIACLKIPSEWTVPEDESDFWVNVPALIDIMVGCYLWNPDYGYFVVTAFDPDGQRISIQRVDVEGTVDPGTTVLACTKFIITVAP